MAHMEIARELARQFLEQMVDDGLFVKVRTWSICLCTHRHQNSSYRLHI